MGIFWYTKVLIDINIQGIYNTCSVWQQDAAATYARIIPCALEKTLRAKNRQ